jgi:hypothetical protein
MPIVAYLPVLDTTMSSLYLSGYRRQHPPHTLSEDRLLFRDSQHLSGVADRREESVGVELAVLPDAATLFAAERTNNACLFIRPPGARVCAYCSWAESDEYSPPSPSTDADKITASVPTRAGRSEEYENRR